MDIRVKISQQLSIFEVYHRMTGRVQNDQKWVFNLFTLEMLRARSRAKIYVTFEKAHLFFRLSKQNIYTETKLYAKNFLSSTVVPLCHLFLNKRVIYYTRMIYSSSKVSLNNGIQCFRITNTQNRTCHLRFNPFLRAYIALKKRYLECSKEQSCFFTSLDQNQMQLTV